MSFLAGAPGFVGSYAMYLLGSFGLGIGVLSMLANAAVRQLERDVKKGMEMLAFVRDVIDVIPYHVTSCGAMCSILGLDLRRAFLRCNM